MQKKTKRCKKCNRRKPLSDFKPLRNSKRYKTEEFNVCKDCRIEQNHRYRDKRMERDLAYALLVDSCMNAYKRGQPYYTRDGYESVTTSWKSIKEMTEDLVNDFSFYEEWKRLAVIYDQNGRKRSLRPSIHRVDSKLGYTPSNVAAVALGEQVSWATSKPVYVVVIENLRFTDVLWFKNKQTALKELRIPEAVFNNSIDFGQVVNGSNGKSYVLQSSDITESKKSRKTFTDPKYWVIINAIFENLVTHEEVLGQIKFASSGLFFNITQNAI